MTLFDDDDLLLTSAGLYYPVFPNTWPKVKLSTLARWINGMAFRDFQFSEAGRPIIKIAEIKNGISGQTKFTLAEYEKVYLIHKGDLLFSWSGQPETSIDAFWWSGPDGWLNQHVFKVVPDEALVSAAFLYYLLKYLNPTFVAIARNKQTTGLGHVTKADIAAIEVGVPSPEEQQAIVEKIWSIDAKIELNRQLNQTLEQMAQALFQSWFVDFEPVKAKLAAVAEGRDPLRAAMSSLSGKMDAELDALPREQGDALAATAALFPEEMEASALGDVPKGWEVSQFGAVIELAYGKALPKTQHRVGTVPVYGSGGVGGFHDTALVTGPGIVVGRKGTVGSVFWIDTDFCAIDTVFYIKLLQSVPLYWVYEQLRRLDIASLGADSAVPGVNRNSVYMQPIVVPQAKLLNRYQEMVQPLGTMLKVQSDQTATLSTLRDALLPKLLSGELTVGTEEAPPAPIMGSRRPTFPASLGSSLKGG